MKSTDEMNGTEREEEGDGQTELPTEHDDGEKHDTRLVVVGLGASAGGLEAFEKFFTHLPAEPGLAFVVVQHLDPDHESLMPDLLSKYSPVPVQKVRDGMLVESNQVYVIPPNALLTLEGNLLRLATPAPPRGHRSPIDVFFRSLAESCGELAVGIVLSGTGSDGTIGLRAIKESGGMTMAEEPGSAKYDSMPRSAVLSGYVDHVLPVEQMPATLIEYARHLKEFQRNGKGMPKEDSDLVRRLCRLLRDRTGHDFSQYKRNTLLRRIQRRLQVTHADSLQDYLMRLREDPKEVNLLLKDLLIGVTQFFRDPEIFEALQAQVIQRLFERGRPGDSIRVWVAGCASGEEAYTLAILLHEQMTRIGQSRAIQIFATDIDEEALEAARRGTYPQGIAEQISSERLERFFTKQGSSYQVIKELREMCIFSAHDLLRDPPFSHLDLVSCRNLLIYLEPEAQKKLVPVFHYALGQGAYLLLGPSENVVGHSDLFTAVNKKARIFQRREVAVPRLMEFPVGQPIDALGTRGRSEHSRTPVASRQNLGDLFKRIMIEDYSPAAAVVNQQGELLQVSGRTSGFLEVPPGPFENSIFQMVRKELRIPFRTAFHKASRSREIAVEETQRKGGGEARPVQIIVRPLSSDDSGIGLFLVLFREHTALPGPTPRPGEGPQPQEESVVEALESELRKTKEDLQSTIEELETSNEELKSSNEELMSMNEELQSANEELQTSKEELQSVNEELQTVNAELSKKIEELNRTNDDLQNLFQSTQIATLFLDPKLRVKRFTPATVEIFRLIDTDLGRPISDITSPFAESGWLEDVREVLRTLVPRERQVSLIDGQRWFMMRILPYRTMSNQIDGVVVTLVDFTELKLAQTSEAHLAAIVESSGDAIIGRTLDGVITSWNRGAEMLYGYSSSEVVGRDISIIVPPDRGGEAEEQQGLAREGKPSSLLETVRQRKDGSLVEVSISTSPIYDAACCLVGLSAISHDISVEKEAERENQRLNRELAQSLVQLQTILDLVPIGIAVAHDPEATEITGNRAMSEMFGMPRGSANLSAGGPGGASLPFRLYRNREEVPAADQILQRVASTEKESWNEEYELRLADGSVKQLLVSAVPLAAEGGQVGGAVAAFMDITERKHDAEELASASRQKDEFLAMLGHELRNPMAALVGATALLQKDGASPKTRERALPVLARQSSHMKRLVDDLLDLNRISRGLVQLRTRELDLVSLVSGVVDDHQQVCQDLGLSLSLQTPSRRLWAKVDEDRIRQVLGNLLSNSCKYSRRGESITVSVEETPPGKVQIAVRDAGIGIEPSVLPHIFEPLVRGEHSPKRALGGLGLGLTISKGLIERQGGTIEARSEGRNRGTTILITLPATIPEQVQKEPESSVGRRLGTPVQRRVLVVEDEPDIAEVLSRLLEMEGHQAEIVADGPSALGVVRRFRPEVVLCDIGLPGMDGFEIARALRRDFGPDSFLLVALTGYSRPEDHDRALESGFDAFMPKPPDLEEVARLVARGREGLKTGSPEPEER